MLTVKLLVALERGPSWGYRLSKELGVQPRQIVNVMLRKLQNRLLVRLKYMELTKSSRPREIVEITPRGRDWLEKNRKFAA